MTIILLKQLFIFNFKITAVQFSSVVFFIDDEIWVTVTFSFRWFRFLGCCTKFEEFGSCSCMPTHFQILVCRFINCWLHEQIFVQYHENALLPISVLGVIRFSTLCLSIGSRSSFMEGWINPLQHFITCSLTCLFLLSDRVSRSRLIISGFAWASRGRPKIILEAIFWIISNFCRCVCDAP